MAISRVLWCIIWKKKHVEYLWNEVGNLRIISVCDHNNDKYSSGYRWIIQILKYQKGKFISVCLYVYAITFVSYQA